MSDHPMDGSPYMFCSTACGAFRSIARTPRRSRLGAHAVLVALAGPTIAIGAAATPAGPIATAGRVMQAAVDLRSKTHVTALLDDGSERSGILGSFDGRIIAIEEPVTGLQWTTDVARIAAIIVAPSVDPASARGIVPLSLGILRLADGQRLPGQLKAGSGKSTAQQSVWQHRWIGAVPLEPERIASISLAGHDAPRRQLDADEVVLANGDVLQGFIMSIGDDLLLEPLESAGPPDGPADDARAAERKPADDATGKPNDTSTKSADKVPGRRIPMDRVAALSFAEVPAGTRGGLDIWTADGSLVGATDLRFSSERGWSFQLADPLLAAVRGSDTADNSAADPLGIVLDRRRFVPLGALVPGIGATPPGTFRHAPQGSVTIAKGEGRALDCGEIRIDGPVECRLMLPESLRSGGGFRLFAKVSLVRPFPADARTVFTIQIAGSGPVTVALDAARPEASITLAAGASPREAIEVRLDDGGNGIAGDRVVVESAFLWLDEPPRE